MKHVWSEQTRHSQKKRVISQLFQVLDGGQRLVQVLNNGLAIKQDWVAFMSQPYWVEVMVEVELRLRLILPWGWNDVEMRFSGSLAEIELRLSWVGVKISWHWIKEEIGLS